MQYFTKHKCLLKKNSDSGRQLSGYYIRRARLLLPFNTFCIEYKYKLTMGMVHVQWTKNRKLTEHLLSYVGIQSCFKGKTLLKISRNRKS